MKALLTLSLVLSTTFVVAQPYMYWSDNTQGTIKRANLDGTNVTTLISGLNRPFSLAIDHANGKIYWGREAPPTIRWANLDGTGVEDLQTSLGYAGELAIDPVQEKLFWVNRAGSIHRADLDGTNEEVLMNGLGDVQGFTLDPLRGQMYWSEYNYSARAAYIKRSDYAGSVVDTVDSREYNISSLVFDPFTQMLHWVSRWEISGEEYS